MVEGKGTLIWKMNGAIEEETDMLPPGVMIELILLWFQNWQVRKGRKGGKI